MPDDRFRPWIDVLLVEDNACDVELIRDILDRTMSVFVFRLHVVTDGEAALTFLRREPPYQMAPAPQLILLDLKLPGIDGFEVLASVKADPAWTRIPVVVFAASDAVDDVYRAYDGLASAYIRKPIEPADFQHAVETIYRFWTEVARLPRPTPASRD